MKNVLRLVYLLVVVMVLASSCEKEVRNIAPTPTTPTTPTTPELSDQVKPVNINEKGFDFLEQMPGHWTGTNRVIADDFDWFAFDYRPISASHVHGIFEGGTMGNLFSSFFVTDFKDTRTIMVRNGGVLNGIYRTSYFVLDSVRYDDRGNYYRFVDAHGGEKTMSMELRFSQDSLYFNAYTSRLGLNLPTRHMTFKGKRTDAELAETAAATVGYPQNVVAWDFSNGFMEEYLQAAEGGKSATFLSHDETLTKDLVTLAQESGDPWIVTDIPQLSFLNVKIERTAAIENATLWLNLSKEPLTDDYGYFVADQNAFNSVLSFPELSANESEFLITYLHPGEYYINITADTNGDGYVSQGDYTHPLQSITINPEDVQEITITDITVEN